MSEWEPFEEVYLREKLHFAADRGDTEEVSQLLNDGYDPNLFDEIGNTPLHYAAAHGHIEVMKLLLDSGANVNAHDESRIGDTPLGNVAGNCSLEVARILVDAGADPTIPGWMQLTALHRAQERKKPAGLQVRKLLEEAAKRFNNR